MTQNTPIAKPQAIDLPRFADDRGSLDQVFNKDLPFEVNRAYVTRSHRGVVRAFHGHKLECKALFAVSGAVKVIAFPMGAEKGGSMGGEVFECALDAGKPRIAVIPAGYYHGYCTLTEESTLLVLSSLTLDGSKGDDYRLAPEPFMKMFEVRHR